jgi:type II secretory pathway predicted ATPase ExeA
VLIVDEAHHLRTDLLEDLRLLTNYAMDSENRLTVVLVGHPELRRRMSMAALSSGRGERRENMNGTPRLPPRIQ